MSNSYDIEFQLRDRFVGAKGATLQSAVHTREPIDGAVQLKTQACQSLFDWWRHADSERVPCRCAFDITDHPHLAPFLFLVDFPAPGQYRVRLAGEMAKAIVGFNTTGLVLKADTATDQDAVLVAHYQAIVASRRPWRCEGHLQGYTGFEAVDCPLTLPGSELIGGIIGALAVIP
jgi:hypothetical protein